MGRVMIDGHDKSRSLCFCAENASSEREHVCNGENILLFDLMVIEGTIRDSRRDPHAGACREANF
jgi:hypothetical protein